MGIPQSQRKQQIKRWAVFVLAGGFFIFAPSAQAAATDITFTEIMYDPAGSDTDREWVEIYNAGNEPITIVEGAGPGSWRFFDGANHTLTLARGGLTISASGVAVLASDAAAFLANYPNFTGTLFDTVMQLNNTADTLKLSTDKGETFFGELTYQNGWGGGGDGKTLEKINLTPDNSAANWRGGSVDNGTPGNVTSPPPGNQNNNNPPPAPPPVNPPTGSASPPDVPLDPRAVKISEVYPNPAKDSEPEFIELWNSGRRTISLEGWKLGDTAKIITLANVTLVPGEYRALDENTTKLTLNNASETIFLYDKDGDLIDKLSYAAAVKGQGLSYDAKQNKFLWSAKPTPSAANEMAKVNEPPQGRVTFSENPVAPNEAVLISAAESSDPDDDPLLFSWSIGPSFQAAGESFTYRFPELGKQLVALTVRDGQHTVVATSTVTVLPATEVVSLRSQRKAETTVSPSQSAINKKIAAESDQISRAAPAAPSLPFSPFSSTPASLPARNAASTGGGEAWRAGTSSPAAEVVDVDLANIRELELGTMAKVQGTVAVPPGVLARTYFYLAGSPGIQVYFSRREFPKLAVGDVIGVIGELTEAGGETRLKVASKQDIVPLYKGKEPEPTEIESNGLGEETEGALVKMQGELVEKRGGTWMIDDGSGEARVVFQLAAKIKKPTVKVGDWVEIIGLASETKSGYRLLPRFASDIRKLDPQEISDEEGQVLGETTVANDDLERFRLPANNRPQTILKYLLITSGGLILLLAGLLIKLRTEIKKRHQ